jgi:hypothetical protein
MRNCVCVPWLFVSFAAVIWSAAVWAQQPKGTPGPPGAGAGARRSGGFRGGFTLDRLLERHDGDKDGKVTREEWQGPEQVFGQMDQDSDGVITKEEFQARMRARGRFGMGRGGLGGRAAPPQESQKPDAAALLNLLDANKDGSISKDELEKFLRKNDSDEDGKLSEDELKVAIASRVDREVIEVEGPSVVEGQKAGIGVGYYAPDFELQPIEPYACLQEWLGGDGDGSIEKRITLSELVGEQPVLLLFGSYT